MRIYINDKEIKKEYSDLSLSHILEKVKNDLEKKIIKKIIINGVEVNEKYLLESLIQKEDIDKMKFVLQNNEDLIKETLDEIDNYLPKLKKGCIKTADLFRTGDFNRANKKYNYILEGINWYTNTIDSIVNLLNEDKYIIQINDMLLFLNKNLSELMQAYKNGDNILVADILEYEISEIVKEFIKMNKKLDKIKVK